jgi:predicted methyltransferase
MRASTQILMIAGLGILWTGTRASSADDPALMTAIASVQRDPQFVARDSARHPAEELRFFGLQSTQSVIELWPGRGYWTEILAPYLAPHGRYTVALSIDKSSALAPNTKAPNAKAWYEMVMTQKQRFAAVHVTLLDSTHFDIAPPGSADLILTFRNLHNWMEGDFAPQALAACFRALKPGGILGIEDHRARVDRPQDPKALNGYVRQDYAIKLAQEAGFKFVASSEINSNPKDTKDWPKGVWTLPPTLELGDQDRAKYLAIGEADNFVLKFRKPAH